MQALKEYECRQRVSNGTKSGTGCETVMRETANVLLVGDTLNSFADQPGAAFGWATVVCVTEDTVELARPYIHVADFTMCPGGQNIGERVVHHTGLETIRLPRHSDRVYSVVFRTQVPR